MFSVLLNEAIDINRDKKYDMTDISVRKRAITMWEKWKKIILLAIPSLASFASVTLTGTISLIMVGKLGTVPIAVVGVTNIIMYNAWALFSGIGHTVNYLVAQNYGANEIDQGVKRTYIALYMSIFAALLVLLIGLFGSSSIFRWMGSSQEMITAGNDYLQLRFFAMAFSILIFVFHGFLRGIGDTKTPMVSSLVGGGIMVFLTYSLTYGNFGFSEYGLKGAGVAFLLAELATLLICAYVYFIKLNPRFRTRRVVSYDRSETKLIFFESSKLGLQEFSMAMAMFVFTIFVTQLGTTALAANEVALNVMSFGFMPAFAFGTTATILVGHQIGQGNAKLGKNYGTHTAIIGSIFLLLVGTLELFLAEPIARMYTDDKEVYELAALLIKTSAYLQLFDGFLNFFAGGLRGIGDTTFLLKISLLLGWLLFIPLSYLFIFTMGMGSMGAWLALYTYLVCFGLSVMIRFYKTDWGSLRKLKTYEKAEVPG
nr:MATE family efflux transporter [Mesobacillus foraminis]